MIYSKDNMVRRAANLSLMILMLIGFLSSPVRVAPVQAEATQSGPIYLPILMKAPRPPVFGAQIKPQKITLLKDLLAESGITWLRVEAFDWSKIEPVNADPPIYDWTSVREGNLKTAVAKGMQLIAIVKFSPPWAQAKPPYKCGPIRQDAFDEFARFLKELVRRYSQPPYNIKYWELGNEPDIDPSLIGENSGFGCWGDKNDPYYGGRYYGEMLKIAYPAIKSADPDARVLIGGLLMDCDPTNPPVGKDCKSSKFLEGILVTGGGAYFDMVNYHGYTPYSIDSFNRALYYEETHSGWAARGGVVLGKLSFIRELMSTYGTNKPVMLTEASLICSECSPPPNRFFNEQADYVIWLFTRAWAAGIHGVTWFTFDGPGWRYGGLLDENQQPRKSYDALNFMTQMLGKAYYTGIVNQFPGVTGYRFQEGTRKVWVIWSTDGHDQSIQLPSGVTTVYNRAGNVITPADRQLVVNRPVYLEFAP